MLSDEDCKRIVGEASRHCGVDPLLVATKLMNHEDKDDLRHERITKRELIIAIITWRDHDCRDMVNPSEDGL